MKANELRIGNLIEKNGLFAKIEIINNELDEVYYLGKDFYYSDFCSDVNPIKLTEEWFIKCQSNSIFNNGFTYRKTKKGRYDIFCGSVFITVIEFVHELQNLNFAILGEELILNKEYL